MLRIKKNLKFTIKLNLSAWKLQVIFSLYKNNLEIEYKKK